MAPRLTEGSALTRQLKSLLARVERDLAHKREAAKRLQEEIGQHERLMRNLRGQLGATAPPTKAAILRVKPGSIEDRVLSIARESDAPVHMQALIEGTKASDYHTRKAVNALIEAGLLLVVGAGVTRRYTAALSPKKGAKS